MRTLTVFFLALLVLGAVRQSDAQTCNTTLAEALAATPALSLLSRLVDDAGLEDILDDPSLNVTVFAPNDDAISAFLQILNASGLTVENVTSPSNNVAASIVLYHVVPIPATAAQLVDGQVLTTLLSGYNLTVEKNASTVVIQAPVSNATVVLADIPVCRSVVHIIDAVLIPAPLGDIPPYEPLAPSPAPPPSPGMATKVESSLWMGAAAAIAAVFAAL